jgi:hypothetical protein
MPVRRFLLVILLLFAVACSSSSPGSESVTSAPPSVRASSPTRVEPVLADPNPGSPVTTTTDSRSTTAASLEDGQSLVAHATGPVEIFGYPELPTPSWVVGEATILGSPRVFLVQEGPIDGWVKLSLPLRPNGSTGWARSGQFEFEVVHQLITVDLSDFRLVFQEGDDMIVDSPVAVGSPSNPTPAGSYFVTDVVKLADPGGPWGPYALGLSAYSDTITEFNGGNGIIGIHGTNRPAKIGHPVSLGCVRVPNELIAEIATVIRLGTPVEIRA